MDDLISRRAAIDACHNWDDGKDAYAYGYVVKERLQKLPSARSDLIAVIQNGIKATDADDEYSCGMRNGMRWCKFLIDDKEPLYENCPSAQPAPQRTFVELVVEYPKPELCPYKECKGKPYYSIKYIENGETYVGYGTYNPKALSQYLIEYFMPSAQPKQRCVNCGRTANNGGWYKDGRTRCPIEEHYALPKDGYCHLWEKRKVREDDYVKRPEEGEK